MKLNVCIISRHFIIYFLVDETSSQYKTVISCIFLYKIHSLLHCRWTQAMGNSSPTAQSVRPPPLIQSPTFQREVTIAACVLYVIIAFLAVFGNGLVVGSFIRHRRLRTYTNFFVMSLAVADILVGLISIPMWLCMLLYSTGDEIYGTVYRILDTFAGSCSIMHLMVISLERYYAVVFPVRHRNISTNIYYAALVVVWVVPALVSGLSGEFRKFDKEAYMLFLFITFFIVPVLVILFAYACIWRAAHNRIQPASGGRSMKRDMRIAVTIALVIGFFVIAWLPFFVVQLLLVFCSECAPRIFDSKLLLANKFMHYSNSAVNPIVYAVKIPEFRRAFQQLVALCVCCCRKRRAPRDTELFSATDNRGPTSQWRKRVTDMLILQSL